MTESQRIFIATPAYGGLITTQYAGSLLKLLPAAKARNVGLPVKMLSGDALITRARANLVSHFLADEAATHIVFIDADLAFEPDQVFRLLDYGADVTAAAYPIKRIDWERVKRAFKAGRQDIESVAMHYVLALPDPRQVTVRKGFAKVNYAGTGFLMIRRRAIEALCGRHPELKFKYELSNRDSLAGTEYRFALFDPLIDTESGTYLSEDFAFCKRWTNLGGEIWIDTKSQLTHVGPMSFVGDVASHFTETKEVASD
jgi:hypothetical protein